MNHRPRKRFGQNFLHDQRIIDAIITAFNPQPEQLVVEIGPGLGALTFPLLEHVERLHVVELDRDIVARLQQSSLAGKRLLIHQADALRFDFAALANQGDSLRVIGNLPYNISTPLLFHLLDFKQQIRDMMFMLQKEVVLRMLAGPGDNNYGRLSVMLQRDCQLYKVIDVPASAFSPPPKVESAVIRLVPHDSPVVTVNDDADFARLVASAFQQRRKTLRNNLRGKLDQAEIEALGIDSGIRAEMLDLEQFAALANRWSEIKLQSDA